MTSCYLLLQIIVIGVEKNNNDARRIIQRKSNHNDDPPEVLRTGYRLEALSAESDSIANTQKGPKNTKTYLKRGKRGESAT